MVSSSSSIRFAVFLVVLWSHLLHANGCYSSIISFGDSISDTGNRQLLASISDVGFLCVPPYGQDFINRSTGRCSNGRLIIDFLAESLGLPLVPPYLRQKGIDDVVAFRQGVNYAVVGATSLNSSFLETRWNTSVINASIGVQLAWFKQSLSSICGNPSDCRNFIGQSLILMGEIGGNDYNDPILEGKPFDNIEYVPDVINSIASTINELIEMGARTLVVPGNFPAGCLPMSLRVYESDNKEYDPITGCLTKLNNFVKNHNRMLQRKLNEIRDLNPNVIIIYADYYNAAMQIYRSPYKYGFTKEGTLNACCGCGGPYNFNLTGKCGHPCTTVCDEPNTYVSWDGIHFTEATYKLVFKSVFQGPYTTPEFYSLCPTPTLQVGVELSSST